MSPPRPHAITTAAPALAPLPGPGAAPPRPPLRVRLRRWPWKLAAPPAGLWLLSAAAFFLDAPFGLAAALGAAAALASHLAVVRSGGWQLFGPHLAYDPLRLARRGRAHQLRALFLLALLFGLWQVYEQPGVLTLNTLAYITERYTFTFFGLLNGAILLLAPIYVGSALAEERERKALDLLYAAPLGDREIVLGKFAGRALLLAGFLGAGLPVLSALQLWGGVDMPVMLGNLANSLLLLLAVSAFCTFVSAVARTVFWAVGASYLALAGPSLLALGFLGNGYGSPLVLADDRIGGRGLTIQLLPFFSVNYLAAIVGFLAAAVAVVRRERSPAADVLPAPPARDPSAPAEPRAASVLVTALAPAAAEPPEPPAEDRAVEHAADRLLLPPEPLPPVGDDALLWKEMYTGGRTFFYEPAVLCLVTALVIPGISLLAVMWSDPTRSAGVLWFYYFVFVSCYAGGVLLRAAACVARERQQGTLDLLLQLPDDRRRILRAKWAGCLWRGWPLLLFVVADVLAGLLAGAYHPLQALWLLVAPWPVILFLASVAMYLSVRMRTVLLANMTLGVLLLPFLYYFVWGPLDPVRTPEQWARSRALDRVMTGLAEEAVVTTGDRLRGGLVGAGLAALYLLAALLVAWQARRRFEDRHRPPASYKPSAPGD